MDSELKNDCKVRILYLVAASAIGGSVYSFYELINNIDKKKYIPIVLITKDECQEFIDSLIDWEIEIIYANIRINPWIITNKERRNNKNKIIWKFKSPGRFFRHFANAYKIASIIKKYKINLVHTNDENLIDAGLGALIASRKHLWHIRARIGEDGYLSHFLGNKYVLNIINTLSDMIVVNSKSTLEPWARINLNHKVLLIHNGINIEKFINRKGCLRKEYGLNYESIIIVMISTILDFDGLEWYIEAVNSVFRNIPNSYFFMIGRTDTCSPEYLSTQKQKIKDFGIQEHFFFTGYRNDIPNILADATVVVEPMQNGSWSRVVLEAMAAGVPVIGVEDNMDSDFIKDGITGILVKKQDLIGPALVELLKDGEKMHCISINAQKYVSEKHSNKKYSEEIMQIYSSLIF